MRFDFTKREYENLKNEMMLNEEESKIFEMKIKGCSIVEISLQLNMSVASVNRRVKKLKKKLIKII